MTALVKSNGGAPVKPSSLFSVVPAAREEFDELSGGVISGFPVLSIRGKVWRIRKGGEEKNYLDDEGEPVPYVDVVLLKGSPHLSKIYYESKYSEGDTSPPRCWSPDSIKPDPAVQDQLAIDEAQAALERTHEWRHLQDLKGLRAKRTEAANEADAAIRENVITEYDGQNKRPYPGIEVKEFFKITVIDEEAALKWCANNARPCLKLDITKLTGVAKALDLPFVENTNEPRVQIASDLSKYLEI